MHITSSPQCPKLSHLRLDEVSEDEEEDDEDMDDGSEDESDDEGVESFL